MRPTIKDEFLSAIPAKVPALPFPVPCRALMLNGMYAVMTDGHQMIAVEDDASDLPDESKKFGLIAEDINLFDGKATTMDALLSLLRAAIGPCETCQGALEAMQPEHITCPGCAERIPTGQQAMRPCLCATRIMGVEIDGAPFDANRMRTVLARLPSPEQPITIGSKGKAITVRGEGWFYVLMGVTADRLSEVKHIEIPGQAP